MTSASGTASYVWPIITALTGVLLVVQASVGLVVSATSGGVSVGAWLCFAMGLSALLAGLWLRWPTLLLFVFPASFAPLIMYLTEEARDLTTAPGRWIVWLLTLLLYAIAAATWTAKAATIDDAFERAPIVADSARVQRLGRRPSLRTIAAVLLLCVPCTFLWFSTSRTATSATHITLCVTAMILLWACALHIFFVSAAIGVDANAVRWDRKDRVQRKAIDKKRPHLRAALYGTCVAGGILGVVLVSL